MVACVGLLSATACSSPSPSGPAQSASQVSDAGPADDAARDGGIAAESGSDADASAPNDGVDRTGVTFAFTDSATWGQSADPAQVDFSFHLQATDPNTQVGVTRFTIWFDGDTPHVFDTPARAGVSIHLFHTAWHGQLLNRADHSQLAEDNDLGGGTDYSQNARPFSPYASGMMHVVVRGVYADGKVWEAEHAFPQQ